MRRLLDYEFTIEIVFVFYMLSITETIEGIMRENKSFVMFRYLIGGNLSSIETVSVGIIRLINIRISSFWHGQKMVFGVQIDFLIFAGNIFYISQ